MALPSSYGGTQHFDLEPQELVKLVTEEIFPELRKEAEEMMHPLELNLKPDVKVSVEEYEAWCRPWRNTLIVRSVGKKIGLRYMSNKLQNIWAKH